MSRRMVLALSGCGLLVLAVVLAGSVPANPPADPPPATGPAVPAAPPAAALVAKESVPAPFAGTKAAASRVVAVTVYPNSALVTREVDVPEGTGSLELVVSPLPPRTVNTSLYTEGTETMRVLTTRFRTRQLMEDTREEVRKLQDEIKQLEQAREKLESEMKAVQANLQHLAKLENYTATISTQGAEKGNLNSDSAISLSKYVMEGRIEKTREQTSLQQQIRLNLEKAEFAQRQLKELTAGASRTEQEAIIAVDRSNGGAGKVRLNYLVDAAAWRPQYKFRTGKAAADPVQLEYLAAVVQQTGESWDNVKLVLSTAQPMLNAAPADLHVLQVTAQPRGATNRPAGLMELQEQVKGLRDRAQKEFNESKQASANALCNNAAALDQSFELLNPGALTSAKQCGPTSRQGPSVVYHLGTKLSVPSRNDEQVVEVARIDLAPEYYYKAVPVLGSHVYRLADLTNRSTHTLLPGEATMYVGADFVGRMNLPLVAVGEQFTAGFGVDPQLQVQRTMIDRVRTFQGGNQVLKFDYRILVSSYKAEKVKVQVWDRLPHADDETVGVNLIKSAPELSKDALYLREQRPGNLLRWDVSVEPSMSGEKALAINYEFKLELERQMTIGGFQAGVVNRPEPPNAPLAPLAPLSASESAKVKENMARLSVEDRRLAEAQGFCAIEEDSPLGAIGVPIKVMCKGQPVFVCCKGCEADAKANPDQTLAKCQKLIARMKANPPKN